MKVKKMLLREETEKILHTKSNGDKLVANSSGQGYSAYTGDDVHIGHIEAETDASAIAEFSKKEPKYEALDMSQDELRITAERYLDFEIGELMAELLEKTSTMSREQLSRLVRLCRNFYALLEEFASDSMTESYMDTHEGVAHVDTLELMAALKSVVREYGHMELVTPLYCELHDDEHGRRLELNRAVDEGLVPDKIGGDVNINLDGSHSSVGFLGGTATNTNNGAEGDHDAANSHNEDLNEADDSVDDDFMDAENIEMKDLDSPVGKEEDIEFVMSEYIPDSLLIEFVKKIEKNKYLVGVEDEVVTVEFDPNWSEYVYTIEGKGPYSHSSYEYIARDVHDFVMANRTHTDEYDDDYDDLSAFNECGEVKTSDALYGVGREDTLTEARYRDSNGIMGAVGATYSEADLKKAWEDGKDNDPSMSAYNDDYDAWLKDTISNMSKNEAFDMRSGIDLNKLSWQVASYLDVEKLGEDKWIEFSCDDPRDLMGSRERTMRFEAIGEDSHKYGFIKTAGSRVEVKFRNGSEAMCNSAEEVARFVAGEFGVTI